MPEGPLYLGIDVSTTAVKAVLVDREGRVQGSASSPLTLETPRPLWSEQHPSEWWRAAAGSIRAVLEQAGAASQVAAAGLTGQMHGLVLLGDTGHVLRPAMLWNDQRTGPQCDEIRVRLGGRAGTVRLTGNDALPGFTASKILWVREHEPAVFAQVRWMLLPKDYVRLQLTGQVATDKADGSGTQLFDLATRDWSPEVLSRLDLSRDCLPPTFEGPETTGRVTEAAAALTGLAPGTPVVAGGGDQAAGAVGAGAVRPGCVSLTLGTSGVVFVSTDRPVIEPEGRLHAFCHAVPRMWHLMAVTLSAAGSLQWYRDTLAPGVPFEQLIDEAEQAPAGCEGLLFLPYLSGERTPYPDPSARGAFVGLTRRHRRADMIRAVLEGVAFSLRDCLGLLREVGLDAPAEIRIAGGGARSQLWRRICASALGTRVVTVTTTEGAAFGAALLAGTQAGAWPDVTAACDATVALAGGDDPVS